MPLTDTTARTAKPTGKTAKLYDEKGLYLEISPSGGKWWRLKYRINGKEKRLSMGVYPQVSLKKAREERDAARKLLSEGMDPSEERKIRKVSRADRAANSFELIAREWLAKQLPTWDSEHSKRQIRLFDRDIFPWMGRRPIAEITAPELLSVLRRIESRGALNTAHRALRKCGLVFRYAIATGRALVDPSSAIRGALPPAKNDEHFPAVTEPDRLGVVLNMLDGYHGTLPVCCALQLAPLLFVRPGELRKAEWKDVDLAAAEWRYVASKSHSKQKTHPQHIVSLSRQAVEILRELYPLTGGTRYIFPSARSNAKPMSDNALLSAMRRMGIDKSELTTHGFRATARTMLDEVLAMRPDFIEHQLAHRVKDPNGRAYNRTAFLPERKVMMQKWADYLDRLKNQHQR